MAVTFSHGGLRATWQVATTSPESNATLEHAAAEDIALLRMQAPRVHGSFSASDQMSEPFYGLLVVTAGWQAIRIDQTSHLLETGDVAVWRSDVSCDFESNAGIAKFQILVPGETMRQNWPRLVPEGRCLKLDPRNALPSLARGFLESTWHQRAYLSSAELGAAMHATLDILERGQNIAASVPKRRIDRLTPIISFIDASLEDPSLRPATIASRFGCSLRSLHLLFAKQGKTISGEIRDRRLERCRLAFSQSRSNLSISEEAHRWGFSDPAHFSKLFKMKYGVSPRDYRKS